MHIFVKYYLSCNAVSRHFWLQCTSWWSGLSVLVMSCDFRALAFNCSNCSGCCLSPKTFAWCMCTLHWLINHLSAAYLYIYRSTSMSINICPYFDSLSILQFFIFSRIRKIDCAVTLVNAVHFSKPLSRKLDCEYSLEVVALVSGWEYHRIVPTGGKCKKEKKNAWVSTQGVRGKVTANPNLSSFCWAQRDLFDKLHNNWMWSS